MGAFLKDSYFSIWPVNFTAVCGCGKAFLTLLFFFRWKNAHGQAAE
jgi:hypothetical protein